MSTLFLLCYCVPVSFLSRENVIYPAEQANFGGDRIGISRSHAAILDDESNRMLGIVKKVSSGEDDKFCANPSLVSK